MRILVFLVVPAVALSSYFLSFGTDYGVALGYDDEWYSLWVGYPYSGFEMFLETGFFSGSLSMSSRLFEENLPGFGEMSVGFELYDFVFDFLFGFSTFDATEVGDSELVGSISLGMRISYVSDTEVSRDIRGTIFGLYRKSARYYFGYTPYGDIGMFPTSISIGLGRSLDGAKFQVIYTFRSGSVAGVPTPVFDVGGLAFRIRVSR